MNEPNEGGFVLLDAGPKGQGVFATRDFRVGDPLLRFGGPELDGSEIRDFTHVIQIGRNRFLGPSGEVDDYVNHSCDPNSFLRSIPAGLELVARKSIAEGEELTFDYSTCIVDEPELPVCYCGSAKCRGAIRAFRNLPRAVQLGYRNARQVPSFALSQARKLSPSKP